MQSFDDLFTEQPAQREETPFDKDAWAAKKQAAEPDILEHDFILMTEEELEEHFLKMEE